MGGGDRRRDGGDRSSAARRGDDHMAPASPDPLRAVATSGARRRMLARTGNAHGMPRSRPQAQGSLYIGPRCRTMSSDKAVSHPGLVSGLNRWVQTVRLIPWPSWFLTSCLRAMRRGRGTESWRYCRGDARDVDVAAGVGHSSPRFTRPTSSARPSGRPQPRRSSAPTRSRGSGPSAILRRPPILNTGL